MPHFIHPLSLFLVVNFALAKLDTAYLLKRYELDYVQRLPEASKVNMSVTAESLVNGKKSC